MEHGNGNTGILSGIKIPDLYRIAKIVVLVILLVIAASAVTQYMAIKTATDAAPALELSPDKNVLGEIATARGFSGESVSAFTESAFAWLSGENANCYSPEYVLKKADDAALKEMFPMGYVAIMPSGKAVFDTNGLDKKVLETKIKSLSLNRELVILN